MSPAPVPILSGLSDIAARYDVVLCDVWGVVHDGRRAFRGPAEALRRFRAGGGTVVLITNAPRPREPIEAQIAALGLPRSSYDEIVTSGDSTVALIAARGKGPFFHIGPKRDRALLEAVQFQTGSAPVLAGVDAAAHVICSGLFDDAVETPDSYLDTYAAMRDRGLEMICANPDVVVHVGDRLIYCAGALAERYAALGGVVHYAGKPHAPIYDLALAMAARSRGAPIERSRVLAIGDGMRTDIAGAARQTLDSLFIAGGIHRDETMSREGVVDPQALARFFAAAEHVPTAVLPDLVWSSV